MSQQDQKLDTASVPQKQTPEQPSASPDDENQSGAAAQPTPASQEITQSQQLKPFAKSESKAHGGKVKEMFSGAKLVSTLVALGYVFTWSERMLTYFRTGFSWYRDIPNMVTGRSLNGTSRLSPLRTASENIKNLFIPGSNNSFINTFSTGEKLVAASTIGGTAYNLWFLLSSREGDIPEGDTRFERLKNILKNSQHHVAQIVNIFTSITLLALGTGRILSGVSGLSQDSQGNRIGFNPAKALVGTDIITKIEKIMPLIAGSALVVAGPLSTYSLLNIKKPKNADNIPKVEAKIAVASETGGDIVVPDEKEHKELQPFAKSQSKVESTSEEKGLDQVRNMFKPSHIKDMVKYAVEQDRIGLICRILGFALDIGSFTVGLARLQQIESGQHAHKFGAQGSEQWNKARALAKQERNVGILGFTLTSLYTIYVYDTLMHAYKKAQEALKAHPHVQEMAR